MRFTQYFYSTPKLSSLFSIICNYQRTKQSFPKERSFTWNRTEFISLVVYCLNPRGVASLLNSGHFIFGEHYLNLSNTIAAKKSSFQAFVMTILLHNNVIRLTSAGAAFGKYLPVSPYSGQLQNQQPETAGPQERPWGSLKSCCWRWGKSLLREYLLLMLA